MKNFRFKTIAGAFCLLLLMAFPAMAQQGSPYQQQRQPDAYTPQAEISDEEMEQAATAYVEIAKIREDFQERLRQAESQEKVQKLQLEANKEMAEVVEDEGLTIQKYNEIIEAVQSDPEMRNKFNNTLQTVQ